MSLLCIYEAALGISIHPGLSSGGRLGEIMRVGMGEFSILRVKDEYWHNYSASVAVCSTGGSKISHSRLGQINHTDFAGATVMNKRRKKW